MLQKKKVKERLQQIVNDFYIVPFHKNVRVVIDVDPA